MKKPIEAKRQQRALVAGTDAANQSAKAAGRDRWNEDDCQVAINAYNKVMGEESK